MKPEAQAARFFLSDADIDHIHPFGSGNVNETYLVALVSGEQRILQRLNPAVFPDPLLVVRNVRLVTDHLQTAAGGRRFHAVTLFAGKTGDAWVDSEGGAWRMMSMVPGGHTCHRIVSADQAMELGRTLGFFHRCISTLAPETLADTLPGFHDTVRYLELYDQLLSGSCRCRPENMFCREFIAQRRNMAHLLEQAGDNIGRGIIHGDPKTANFLFDSTLKRVISLIDLDTVKPGIFLHDLGDAIRSCCNPAGETPKAADAVSLNPDLFTAWLNGYFTEAAVLLTQTDRDLVVDATALIAFELGLRFYSDYLAGDRYFRVRSADQNLQRALVQFHLVLSVEGQARQLKGLVSNLGTLGQEKG